MPLWRLPPPQRHTGASAHHGAGDGDDGPDDDLSVGRGVPGNDREITGQVGDSDLDFVCGAGGFEIQTHLEADAQPLPPGDFVSARVALFPFAHVLRPGSRLRLNIEAPGGNQPFWQFDTITPDGVRNDIGHSIGRPSKVVLPVLGVPDAPDVLDAAPPCPSVRNQPCRDYLPARVATDVHLVQVDDGTLEVRWTPPERGGQPANYIVSVQPRDQFDSGGSSSLAALKPAAASDVPATVDGSATAYAFAAEPGVAYVATVQAIVLAPARRAACRMSR